MKDRGIAENWSKKAVAFYCNEKFFFILQNDALVQLVQGNFDCWTFLQPTISEIYVNYHQDFLASTHSNFFEGQTIWA
jgi:hypothetical protein